MKNNIFIIFKKEINEVFRDKKSLKMMLMVPLMIPLIVFGMSGLFESMNNPDISSYNKVAFTYELNSEEKTLLKMHKIDAREIDLEKAKKQLKNSDINIYVTKKDNTYSIYSADNENSIAASSLLNKYFGNYKELLQRKNLTNHGIDAENVINIIKVDNITVEDDSFIYEFMTNYVFGFILMAITVSATYPATDTTAGEKERGTLETLLTFPIMAKDIIIGKFLSVSVSSIITGIISLILAVVSLNVAEGSFEIYKNINLSFSAASIFFSIMAIIVHSLIVSGLYLLIASRAKSFKEAQGALSPFSMLFIFPAMVASVLNIATTTTIALIPIINVAQIFKDITSLNYDFTHIFVYLISSVILISIIVFINIKQYKGEEILFSK